MTKRMDIDKRKEEILSLYNSNSPITKIAKLMNCDFCVIKRILKEDNIIIRKIDFYHKGIKNLKRRLDLPEEEIIKLYKEKHTVNYIAKLMNCDSCVIKRILQENNLKIRPFYFYNTGERSSNWQG